MDPNEIKRYRFKGNKRRVPLIGSIKDGRYVHNVRFPRYLWKHIKAEANAKQRSFNSIVIEMLEAALSPE